MSSIAITIMTVARAGDYLDRTLASLAPDRPVTLMVGAPETGYLDRYRGDPSIKVVAPSPEDFAFLEAEDVGRRAAWNYWRCLGEGAGEARVLIFEDDVIFAAGWEARIARTVEQIERTHADYVVSLYYPYPPEESPRGYIDYPRAKFYGTQGVLFAGRARAEFREFLRDRGVERWTLPYDLLLQRYAIEADIPLFATMPSLVQHIGAVTTGQSGHFHTTDCFVDDLDRPDQDADARRR